jgi:hypothetical protein
MMTRPGVTGFAQSMGRIERKPNIPRGMLVAAPAPFDKGLRWLVR